MPLRYPAGKWRNHRVQHLPTRRPQPNHCGTRSFQGSRSCRTRLLPRHGSEDGTGRTGERVGSQELGSSPNQDRECQELMVSSMIWLHYHHTMFRPALLFSFPLYITGQHLAYLGTRCFFTLGLFPNCVVFHNTNSHVTTL